MKGHTKICSDLSTWCQNCARYTIQTLWEVAAQKGVPRRFLVNCDICAHEKWLEVKS